MKVFATYGDGISDINLNKLLKFREIKNLLRAVRPPADSEQLNYQEIKLNF